MAVDKGVGTSRQPDNDYRLRARINPTTSASIRRTLNRDLVNRTRANAVRRANSKGAAPAVKVSRKSVVKAPRVRVSPQNLVANAHRAGANSVANARIPKIGVVGQVGSALSGAGNTLDRRFGPSSRPQQTRPSPAPSRYKGLKKYPGGDTPGGAIGRAHQSFFDIGEFFRNLGKR